MILAFLLALLGLLQISTDPGPTAPAFTPRWTASSRTITITGPRPGRPAHVPGRDSSISHWNSLCRVVVPNGTVGTFEETAPIRGSYRVQGAMLTFQSRYPLDQPAYRIVIAPPPAPLEGGNPPPFFFFFFFDVKNIEGDRPCLIGCHRGQRRLSFVQGSSREPATVLPSLLGTHGPGGSVPAHAYHGLRGKAHRRRISRDRRGTVVERWPPVHTSLRPRDESSGASNPSRTLVRRFARGIAYILLIDRQ